MQLRGVRLPYRRLASPRAKQIRVIVSREDGLVVRGRRAPSRAQAEKILLELSSWVLKHTDKLAREPQRQRLVPVDGAALPWLGQELLVRRINGRPGTVRVDLQRKLINIAAPPGDPKTLSYSLEIYGRWAARRRVIDYVDRWSRAMEVSVKRLRIGDMKSRWASASSRGTLSISWRIMALPDELLDYLVVHELAHFTHMNHGPDFWTLVELTLPGARSLDQQLSVLGSFR